MFDCHKIKYLGFGSPLMDIIVDVDHEHINKYGLKLDTTIHQSFTKTYEIIKCFEKDNSVTYIPGGCSYNTMRVFNKMIKNLKQEKTTGLLGSIGVDKNGTLYENIVSKEDILLIFEKIENLNTGISFVYCHNGDRGHLTDLGASTLISNDFVENVLKNFVDLKLIFTELFILKCRKNIVYQLAEHSLRHDIIFGFNLPSLCHIEDFLDDILNLIEYADILFANLAEANHLSLLIKLYNLDPSEICLYLVKIPKKFIHKRRVVVITNGSSPALIAEYDFILNKLTYFSAVMPENIDNSKLKDTNGAGDAFAGGFLSRYVNKESLNNCMKAGHWAASVIIQSRGCLVPDEMEYYEII